MPVTGSATMAKPALRPPIAGTRHGISAGHYLAAEAGFAILEDGGNAIDAGIAAVIALAVVQSNFVNVAGVAPIILYSAEHDELVTIDGLGTWPAKVTLALFEDAHGGAIPEGLLRTVVPAAPDAWITALKRYGTVSFADAARAAIRFASEGFVMYPMMAEQIAAMEESFSRWPSSAAVYLPGGAPPVVGENFVQADLGRTLRYMADQEAAAKGDRAAGLEAARAAFYRGDIAATVCAYHAENGGLLIMDDMAGYRVTVEPPVQARFGETDVYACGPWCQGPVLLQSLQILKGFDLAALGHNTPEYVHTVTEAIKLGCADRERHYGDPKFVDVPMERLLSDAYAAERRALIRADVAFPELPPPGLVAGETAAAIPRPTEATADAALDTSYACSVDRHGNVFSATPSDVANDTPVVPGTGLCVSSRGAQSWAVAGHASAVAPGKRPRLTPNPALALGPDGRQMPFGHAGRRRPEPGHAPGVPQPPCLRDGRPTGGRGAALREPQLPQLLRAPRLSAGTPADRGPARRDGSRRSCRARPRRGGVGRLDLARGLDVRDRQGPSLGVLQCRRRPAAPGLCARLVEAEGPRERISAR